MCHELRDHALMDNSDASPPVEETSFAEGDSFDVAGRSGCNHLADAAALLRSSLGDDEAQPWSLDALRDRQAAEVAVLAPWIEQRGLWLNATSVTELWLGGSEHDVARFGAPLREVIRITKPALENSSLGYGFCPRCAPQLCLAPASLSTYLNRWELVATVFPEVSCRLEGFVQTPSRWEVVTRQRYIPGRLLSDLAEDIGKKEMQAQVDHWFRKRGFTKLCLPQHIGPSHAWYREADNLAIFDAKPANLIEWEGHLFLIDVIPVQPEEALLRAIRAALE